METRPETSLQRYHRLMENAAGRLSTRRLEYRVSELPWTDLRFYFAVRELDCRA